MMMMMMMIMMMLNRQYDCDCMMMINAFHHSIFSTHPSLYLLLLYSSIILSWLRPAPRVVSELLIFLASSSRSPFAPVLETFSEPARSTRNKTPVVFDDDDDDNDNIDDIMISMMMILMM
jgi:hypothetical protein